MCSVWVSLLAASLSISGGALPTSATYGTVAVYVPDDWEYPDRIRLVDLKSKSVSVVWQAPSVVPKNQWDPNWTPLEGFYLSPEGSRLAVFTVDRYPPPDVSGLTMGILDLKAGQYMAVANDSYRASWSPDGARIAFTRARAGTGEPYQTKGSYIYDLRSRTETKICEGGNNVYWKKSDGHIYIWDIESPPGPAVLRYDPATAKTARSDHLDVNFSPDEKYYFQSQDMEGTAGKVHVYETATDRPWGISLSGREESWKFAIYVEGWLDDRTLVTDFWSPDRKKVKPAYYMLNIETGDMRRSRYRILGLLDSGKKVLEVTGMDTFQIRNVSELETVTKEMVVPQGRNDLDETP